MRTPVPRGRDGGVLLLVARVDGIEQGGGRDGSPGAGENRREAQGGDRRGRALGGAARTDGASVAAGRATARGAAARGHPPDRLAGNV